MRAILTIAEDDVAPSSEGQRADGASRIIRPAIGMDAHAAEVDAEARLEEGPLLARQWLAAADGIDTRFGLAACSRAPGYDCAMNLLLIAIGAETLRDARLHPHHLLGDAVGLLLIPIARLIDDVLRLDRSHSKPAELVAQAIPKAQVRALNAPGY